MPRGFSLTELAVSLTVAALLLAAGLPRLADVLDWVAADRAARDVSTALAVARAAAVMRGTRTRVTIAGDTLRIDRWEGAGWRAYQRWPGPITQGVTLEVSNPEVVFGPTDRKSTRLNSSHGSISYAVFCLKKKKQTHSKID